MSILYPKKRLFSDHYVIGTGLWIGTGTVLAQGGPASALIAYILVGASEFSIPVELIDAVVTKS